MNQYRKVDFFIIGAPKSGTTSLVHYLRSHPRVFIPRIKEPHFFCTDFDDYRQVTSLSDYNQLFAPAPFNARLGEASVWYLYSQLATRNILKYNPSAKIIVILRNPVEMLYSLHSQLVYSMREDIFDFKEAWLKQQERKIGIGEPRHCIAPQHLQYYEVGKLGTQIEKIIAIVPKENLKIIIFDDFISRTKEIYENVLNFINIETNDFMNFPIINENKVHRFHALSSFLMHPPFPLNRIKQFVRNLPILKHKSAARALYAFLSVKKSRQPLDESFQYDLYKLFLPEVEKIELFCQVPLEKWKK
jgi:hypothetical protein